MYTVYVLSLTDDWFFRYCTTFVSYLLYSIYPGLHPESIWIFDSPENFLVACTALAMNACGDCAQGSIVTIHPNVLMIVPFADVKLNNIVPHLLPGVREGEE